MTRFRPTSHHSVARQASAVLIGTASLAATSLLAVSPAGALEAECVQEDLTVTCTYTADGSLTVPDGVSKIRILAVGGNGAAGTAGEPSGTGGSGDAAISEIPVNGSAVAVGQTLDITIGGNASGGNGGANGGGDGGLAPAPLSIPGGGGGGATVVEGPGLPHQYIAIAAGGGGGGNHGVDNVVDGVTPGGDGGSANLKRAGLDGGDGTPESIGGKGAVGQAGGAGGTGAGDGDMGSDNGSGGDGGNGDPAAGGGGGAGFTGGGGGGGGTENPDGIGSAGGGAAGLSFTAGTFMSHAASDGDPRAVITYVVAPSTFDPGPTASITGTPKVGSTLTADEGSPEPMPDAFEYQWYAGGTPIDGATNETFAPTSDQIGKAITVKVTAVRSGYTDASDTSDPTVAVTSGGQTAEDGLMLVGDGNVAASCLFDVVSESGTTVLAKFTTKAKEIKPSVFAPRRVASITMACTAQPAGFSEAATFGTSFTATSSSMYRTRYVRGAKAGSYELCAKLTYRLRTGVIDTLEECSS